MLSTLDPGLVDLLEAGSTSNVVCVLTPDGEPFATRAWGIEVLSDTPLRLRVVFAAGELASVGRVAGDSGPFPIALTAADVSSLRSVQVKGQARDLEGPTVADHERFLAYASTFFSTVHHVDGYRPEILGRIAPADLVVGTVDVVELYDQTPGPGAGAAISDGRAP